MQTQLSQIVIFGKTFSRRKLLFYIRLLKGILSQGNYFRTTCHAALSTCKTCLIIRSIFLTTRNTRLSVCPFLILALLYVGLLIPDPNSLHMARAPKF